MFCRKILATSQVTKFYFHGVAPGSTATKTPPLY